jgi:phytoene dehydrogenase-like protein
LPTIGLSADKEHVVLRHDFLRGVSSGDSDAYGDYARRMRRFAGVLKPLWLKSMPRFGNNNLTEKMTFAHIGLNLRRIGKQDMREFLRVVALPTRDLMDETFDDDLLKATLSWDGLIGSRLAPRSPNSAVLAMLYRMAGETNGAHAIPAGGVAGLIESLGKSATASGAEIRCGASVSRISIDGSADGLIANGVELADGEKVEADHVVSATDPTRTFLDLVGVEHLDIGFTNRIRRLRCHGYVAKLHLALNDLPEFDGLRQPDGRMIIAPDMDAIEVAFDDAKYGECSTNPVMEIVLPSVHDASLAPTGQHVLSAHVMYVPYKLKGGWTDVARKLICERVIDTIAQYAPRIREMIVHQEFLTPLDLEHSYRVTGGHWHHAEFAMDQMFMMRPTYEAAQYRTPIPGLFLCSAGCHPGGDITGGAGHNAAREILLR